MLHFYINIDQDDKHEFLWFDSVSSDRLAIIGHKNKLFITASEFEYLDNLSEGTLHIGEESIWIDYITGVEMPHHEISEYYRFTMKCLLSKYGTQDIFDSRNIL